MPFISCNNYNEEIIEEVFVPLIEKELVIVDNKLYVIEDGKLDLISNEHYDNNKQFRSNRNLIRKCSSNDFVVYYDTNSGAWFALSKNKPSLFRINPERENQICGG